MDQLELLEYLPGDLFVGKVVFITGGGSGINLGIARAFASLGADLAIRRTTIDSRRRSPWEGPARLRRSAPPRSISPRPWRRILRARCWWSTGDRTSRAPALLASYSTRP